MPAIIALMVTFAIGVSARIYGCNTKASWLSASAVMPLFVLFAEFVLPHQSGGASMWPIALLFGAIYGVIVGGIGVLVGSLWLKWRTPHR